METQFQWQHVDHGSPDWEAVVELRREVLRRPLGLDFSPEELQSETEQIVVAGFDGDRAVACALIKPLPNGWHKVRQVAVDPSRQGTGLGRKVMEECERYSLAAGAIGIEMNARDTAIPFYLRLAYLIDGEGFEEVGIPHHRMIKRLGTNPA